MRYLKLILVFGLLVVVGGVWGQSISPAQDSLLQYLVKNQADLKSAIQNYQSLAFNWKELVATLTGFVFLLVLAWKLWLQDWLKTYIRKKSEEAIDQINNLKNSKILVVSNGDEAFLKSFFKEKKFPNVKFVQMPKEFQPVHDFDYDLIFGNNDNGALDKTELRKFVKEDNVLFYFGKPNSWDFDNDTPELSRKINFANSRAQIYGNLISSLEFLELVKPKIKNV